jgi:DNA-binding response OmpR family regulator
MTSEIKYRVIILEQHEIIRDILCDFFHDRGYEVHAYPSPGFCPLHQLPSCRCGVEETCCDIMIIDMDLPEINGLQFISNLKEKDCKCGNVLLISSVWHHDMIAQAQELNCQVLAKPFGISTLIKQIAYFENNISSKRRLRNWIFETSL